MEEEMKCYTFSYWFKGKRWASEVYAHSFEEAEEKVKAMSQATVNGIVHCSIYIPVKEKSWFARLIASIAKKLA